MSFGRLHETKLWRKGKACYMDTDSFIIYIKTEHTYTDNTKVVATRFDTSNDELDRPLPKIRK